jgi:ComF family protein
MQPAAMDPSPNAATRAPVPAAPGLFSRLRRLLAPHCAVCGLRADAAPLCSGCRRDFFAPAARCRQCGLRLAHGERCGRCLRDQPDYDATVALADYVAPVDGLVVALKFGHRLELAALFGALLAARLAPVVRDTTLLLPVPLAFERQAERGFNQAREIARVVQRQLRCPLLDGALLRTRHGAPQESLDADARRRNVRKAFTVAAAHAQAVRGAEVVVIDDVMTSGATLGEIARVLKQGGAARVTNAIVARTP